MIGFLRGCCGGHDSEGGGREGLRGEEQRLSRALGDQEEAGAVMGTRLGQQGRDGWKQWPSGGQLRWPGSGGAGLRGGSLPWVSMQDGGWGKPRGKGRKS